MRQLIERHAADLAERIAALTAMRDDLECLARRARVMSATAAADAAFCPIIES